MKNKLLKKIKIPLLVILITILIVFASRITGLLKIIQKRYFPCPENEIYSAPCGLEFYINLYLITAGIILISFISIIVISIIYFKKKK